MTDGQAKSFVQRWVTLDGDNPQLRLKYIPEFEKVISPKKAHSSSRSTVELA
jgi:hypothetical protein